MGRPIGRLYRACTGRREAFRRLAAPALLGALALGFGGCSIVLPVWGSASAEDEPVIVKTTASVPAPSAKASPLAADLGPEDWRRARGALDLALDPQGNGKPVSWDNPETGLKGKFTPVGSPFLKSDEICRAFTSSMVTQAGPKAHRGTACRPSGGDWAIGELSALKQP